MKILYHHRIGSKDGQFVHVEELTSALQTAGHEIIMVAPKTFAKGEFGSESGWISRLKRSLPAFLYELLEFSYTFLDYFHLARAIRKHRPDCIYERYSLYLPSGVWAKKRFGLPLILEVNSPLYQERKAFHRITLDKLACWSERFVWQRADFVLPVTQVLARHVIDAGVPESRIVVVHNGVNQKRFSSVPDVTEAKRRLGLDGFIVLGFVGFMREWHGLEQVIELVARNKAKNLYFLAVGDGPARQTVLQQARDQGAENRVSVTGVIGRGEVADYIAAFDVALQPDVVAYASPLKLFEYMQLGRAIVAPAMDNIREILADGQNAVLFDPGDSGDFAAAIQRLIQDPGLRQRLALNARQTIDSRNFTWHHNAERVSELMARLLRNSSSRRRELAKE